MKRYTVIAAYVTVRTMTNEGPRIVGLMAGAPWPADAPEDATRHHLAMGQIEEIPGPVKAAEPAKDTGDGAESNGDETGKAASGSSKPAAPVAPPSAPGRTGATSRATGPSK